MDGDASFSTLWGGGEDMAVWNNLKRQNVFVTGEDAPRFSEEIIGHFGEKGEFSIFVHHLDLLLCYINKEFTVETRR